MTDEAADAVLEGNCGVPNVHIRWNVDGAWEAIVVAGPHAGFTLKSFVAKLTAEKWQKAAESHKYKVPYMFASPWVKKLATYHFIEAHMKATLAELAGVPSEPAVAG